MTEYQLYNKQPKDGSNFLALVLTLKWQTMNKLFDILLKLGAITILIAGWTIQAPNYYVFLHSFVFLISIYFAYKTRHVVGIFGIRFGIIFFCVASILFNPFMLFEFPKATWIIIDMVLIADLILFLRLKEYVDSLPQIGRIIFKLIKECFITIGVILLLFWIILSKTGNPYNEFLLTTKSKIANGFILNGEYENDVLNYEYRFTTQEGNIITNWTRENVYEFDGKPVPIQVEYLSRNPEINRIKNDTIGGYIWIKIGLEFILLSGLCSTCVLSIRSEIKNYLSQKNSMLDEINSTENEY